MDNRPECRHGSSVFHHQDGLHVVIPRPDASLAASLSNRHGFWSETPGVFFFFFSNESQKDQPYFVQSCGAQFVKKDLSSSACEEGSIHVGGCFFFLYLLFFSPSALLVSETEPCAKLPLGEVWGCFVDRSSRVFFLTSSECSPLSSLFDVDLCLKLFFSSARKAGFPQCSTSPPPFFSPPCLWCFPVFS